MILLILWACLSKNIDEIQPKKSASTSQKLKLDTPNRIVAIGDLHADAVQTKAVFRLAGLIDENDHWIDDRTVVIQTGDITDRGPDGKETLDLIMRFEKEAKGRFIPLMGNHEAMTLSGDWRYVSQQDYASFGGVKERRRALLEPGKYREWLMTRPAVAIADRILFVHGGISNRFAKMASNEINKTIQHDLAHSKTTSILTDEGPLWYRGLMLADEPLACQEVAMVLEAQDVDRIVVGHTTQRTGKIASRCKGRLLGIDIGISAHYGANIGFLDIDKGRAKAVYLGQVMDLPNPP